MFALNLFVLFVTFINIVHNLQIVSAGVEYTTEAESDHVNNQKKDLSEDNVSYRDIKSILDDFKKQIIQEHVNIRLDNLNNRLDIINSRLDREFSYKPDVHHAPPRQEDNAIVSNRLDTLESNFNKSFQKLASIINDKLVEIESITITNEQSIEKMLNNLTKSVASEPRPEPATCESTNGDINSTLCNIQLPRNISIQEDIWQEDQVPESDELDEFITDFISRNTDNRDGYAECKGMAQSYEHSLEYDPAGSATFDGERWQVHIALRARRAARINLQWNNQTDYYFGIGENENNKTFMRYQCDRVNECETLLRDRPYELSADRYIWYYVQLQPNTMTFGQLCDRGEPLLSQHPIKINKGENITVSYTTLDPQGVKILYCPW